MLGDMIMFWYVYLFYIIQFDQLADFLTIGFVLYRYSSIASYHSEGYTICGMLYDSTTEGQFHDESTHFRRCDNITAIG